MSGRRDVHVALGERSYDITIGRDLLATMGSTLQALDRPKSSTILLITDDFVHAEGYATTVQHAVEAAGYSCALHVIPNGEESKSLHMAETLYKRALHVGLDRKSTILALGGGVVGDLAGFVAATYMRGIPYIQLPTTVQAHDASVGGKVAVDLVGGKNTVGAFHQPLAVVYDIETLRSLPLRQVRSGLAEVIKHGAIRDAAFFTWLTENLADILALRLDTISSMLARSCAIKADIVSRDEKEDNIRALLNFGHTVGHALEAWSGYTRYTHGEAISIGMMAACALAENVGVATSSSVKERLERLFLAAGLPTVLPSDANLDSLIELMYKDKKSIGKALTFVLVEDIGKSAIYSKIEPSDVVSAMLRVKER